MGIYSTSERTRQALIEAAGQLLAERGVGRVSTRAIAQKAGENLGTIHYHFGSKEGLLKETLRFACQTEAGYSLADVIRQYREHLDTAPAQMQAVRQVVHVLMRAVFSPDRPRWCSRALYQVAQYNGPLRVFLREQVLDPHFDAITSLVLRVRPEWTSQEVYLWAHMLIGPAVYHADHCEIVLDRLGAEAFPEEYIARLEQRIADDAVHSLGLPTEAN